MGHNINDVGEGPSPLRGLRPLPLALPLLMEAFEFKILSISHTPECRLNTLKKDSYHIVGEGGWEVIGLFKLCITAAYSLPYPGI